VQCEAELLTIQSIFTVRVFREGGNFGPFISKRWVLSADLFFLQFGWLKKKIGSNFS